MAAKTEDDRPNTPVMVGKLIGAMSAKWPAPSDGPPGSSRPPASSSSPPQEPSDEAVRRRAAPLKRAWASVPAKLQWASFADEAVLTARVQPAGAVKVGREATERGLSMVLIGNSGAGKTSLAVACMQRVLTKAQGLCEQLVAGIADQAEKARAERYIRRAGSAFFVTAFNLAKAGAQSALGAEPELVKRALSSGFLVLDDLGTDVEHQKASATAIRDVLHERHAHGRVTIVTTYLSQPHIGELYGEGIQRRLGEWVPIKLHRAAKK